MNSSTIAVPAATTSFGASPALVAKLLLALSGLVLVIVVWGAVVRLTGSGLSIPDWPLINGSLLPPFTETGWQAVQEDYHHEALSLGKEGFPPNLSVSRFRAEFFIEWCHRALAALVGILLAIILVLGFRSRAVKERVGDKLYLLGCLLLAQAGLGGVVVVGALQPFLIAVHLLVAYFFFAVIIYTALQLFPPTDVSRGGSRSAGYTPILLAWGAIGLVTLQVLFGGLVAGSGAANIMNTFPSMLGGVFPPADLLFSTTYNGSNSLLLNPVFLQFSQRWLPFIALGLFVWLRFSTLRTPLKSRTTVFFRAGAALFVLQILIGIANLLYRAPTPLSALHSAVALSLFGVMVALTYDLQHEAGEAAFTNQ